MRGLVPGLPTAVPLATTLPRLLAEDDYARRFTAALDTVLAPALGCCDNLTAYLDPGTAPADFLEWLGHWVAAPADQTQAPGRTAALRRFVPAAASIGARRGTAGALADELGRLCGVDVTVHDRGGVTWSRTAGSGPPPAPPTAAVQVLVRGRCDPAVVRRLVRRSTPAHLPVDVTFAPDQPDQPDQHDQEEET